MAAPPLRAMELTVLCLVSIQYQYHSDVLGAILSHLSSRYSTLSTDLKFTRAFLSLSFCLKHERGWETFTGLVVAF